jgi:hypothetical protein
MGTMTTRADGMDEDTEAEYREAFQSAQTPEEALALIRDFMEPVQGTEITELVMYEMLERLLAFDPEDAEALAHAAAQKDLDAVMGKILVIPAGYHVNGYEDAETFEEILLQDPAFVRVDSGTIDTHTPGIILTDPTWDVTLVVDHWQLRGLDSLMIYGPNYSRKTGKLDKFRPKYEEFKGELVRIKVTELAAPRVEELTVAIETPVYNGLRGTSVKHEDGGLIQDKHDTLAPVLEAIRTAGFEGNDTTRVKIIDKGPPGFYDIGKKQD